VLSIPDLAARLPEYRAMAALPIPRILIGGTEYDLDSQPVIMGVVNLSRDSTYRDSVAVGTESAVRRGRIMAAQGASIIDIGAESSTLRAARVDTDEQVRALVPVIAALSGSGITTSVESYEPAVLQECLAAGATVINLTGSAGEDRVFDLAAECGATVVMCYSPGANVREVRDLQLAGDPFPGLIEHFGVRLARARALGVTSLVVDPGMGFYYGNLTDPLTRARHQSRILLGSYRLRELGVPICQALPHAFDLFEEEFRTAEGFFAVLAALGRVNVYRTHEVARVRATLRALDAIGQSG
jgi:dihydropteroate synthase